MVKRLIVYGLLAICATWVFTTKAQRPQREETEILIVASPINQLNPVVRNPYQTEYEQMLYPTVRITAGWSTGSGVIISVERRALSVEGIAILTAAHVVEDQSIVDIELYDSSVITGTVVITDTDKDLALIRTQINADFRIYGANLAPQDYTPYIFTPVYTIGCSLGLAPRPSQGIISAITTPFYSPLTKGDLGGCYEISAPILPGNSGGPVFDKRTYEVIGIAVWVKVYDGQLVTTMAGVVPINEIYNFLTSHEDTKK